MLVKEKTAGYLCFKYDGCSVSVFKISQISRFPKSIQIYPSRKAWNKYYLSENKVNIKEETELKNNVI